MLQPLCWQNEAKWSQQQYGAKTNQSDQTDNKIKWTFKEVLIHIYIFSPHSIICPPSLITTPVLITTAGLPAIMELGGHYWLQQHLRLQRNDLQRLHRAE